MKLNVLKENIASLEFTDEKFLIVKAQILKANHGMIYFDEKTQTALTERMLRHLDPCGFFFIGHSETVSTALRQKLRPLAPAAFEKT